MLDKKTRGTIIKNWVNKKSIHTVLNRTRWLTEEMKKMVTLDLGLFIEAQSVNHDRRQAVKTVEKASSLIRYITDGILARVSSINCTLEGFLPAVLPPEIPALCRYWLLVIYSGECPIYNLILLEFYQRHMPKDAYATVT